MGEDMSDIDKVKNVIRNKINNDIDWANPYWQDVVKEEHPDILEKELDDIYAAEMKKKVDALSNEEAQSILNEQNSLTSANQNFFLANLLEEKLG